MIKLYKKGGLVVGIFSKLFSKQSCEFCGKDVGFFNRKRLVSNEGYICKECEKKTSALTK